MGIYHKLTTHTGGTADIALETVTRAQAKTSQSCKATTALQRTGRVIIGLAFGLSLSFPAAGKAEFTTFKFKKIADTNTLIPSGTGKFTSFSSPLLDNKNVAFGGNGTPQQEPPYFPTGIYTNVGDSLNVVADTSTPIPGAPIASFVSFGYPSLDNGNVAFFGYNNPALSGGFSANGIYTNVGGSLNVVADTNTLIPGGTGNFTDFSSPSFDNGNIAFSGFGASKQVGTFELYKTIPESCLQRGVRIQFARPRLLVCLIPQGGIYINVGGSLNVVADTNTPIPGSTGNFTDFGDISFEQGNVAFRGGISSYFPFSVSLPPDEFGLYTNVGGSLSVVADLNTPIPGGSGNFTGFSSPSLDNGNVAFLGFGSSQAGIYTKVGGSLNVVADLNTPIPGGTGNFTSFIDSSSNLSFDNGSVVFVGNGNPDGSQQGIYTTLGGELVKVIAKNDSLDGKIINAVILGSEALSGERIAFSAVFTDGSQGIYVASLKSKNKPKD